MGKEGASGWDGVRSISHLCQSRRITSLDVGEFTRCDAHPPLRCIGECGAAFVLNRAACFAPDWQASTGRALNQGEREGNCVECCRVCDGLERREEEWT